MNKFLTLLAVTSMLASPAYAVDDNMVMIPVEAPPSQPVAKPAAKPVVKSAPVAKPAAAPTPMITRSAPEETMVVVPLPYQPPANQPQENQVAMPINEDNMVMLPESTVGTAQAAYAFVPITGPNYVEAGINYHNVSNNQGDWFGQFINGQLQTDPYNRWNAQLLHQEAFHDNGVLVGVGNTHTFDQNWFTDVNVAVASDTSFFSQFRVDANVNRRWLDGLNLVTTAGLTYAKASEVYDTVGMLLGASYYFESPFIIQGGVRVDYTSPGGTYSPSAFLALTHGYQKRYYITGRVGYGREAYQLLNSGNIINAFNSSVLGLNWRQWIGDDWGFNLGTEYYKNPTYHRVGGIGSVFKEF